jgi:hypothetical protein
LACASVQHWYCLICIYSLYESEVLSVAMDVLRIHL